MKRETKVVLAMTILALCGMLAAFTSAKAAELPVQARVEAIRDLALRCAIQPYRLAPNGEVQLTHIQSVCSELQVDEAVAQFAFGGATLRVEVRDSQNSDGGDLNTVLLVDEQGRESVIADDVLAFRDPVLAVLGADAQRLPRVYDKH